MGEVGEVGEGGKGQGEDDRRSKRQNVAVGKTVTAQIGVKW